MNLWTSDPIQEQLRENSSNHKISERRRKKSLSHVRQVDLSYWTQKKTNHSHANAMHVRKRGPKNLTKISHISLLLFLFWRQLKRQWQKAFSILEWTFVLTIYTEWFSCFPNYKKRNKGVLQFSPYLINLPNNKKIPSLIPPPLRNQKIHKYLILSPTFT